MTLGENIRKARKALGLSQEALGELTGANRVTISKYENDEYNPSVPALKRLADALKTTPAELTGDQQIYLDKETEEQDVQITIMARAMKQMTPEQREMMVNLGKAAFAKYFDIPTDNENT